MMVVIDTNVLPRMFAAGHVYRPIAEAWFEGVFSWAVRATSRRILKLIESVEAVQGNLHRVSPSFFFHLISADRDDDKFADCAIGADAELIITSDKHFSPLIGSGYKPQPITPEDFIARILTPE